MERGTHPNIRPHQTLDEILAEQRATPSVMPDTGTDWDGHRTPFQIKPFKDLMASMTGGERLALMVFSLICIGLLGRFSMPVMILGFIYAFGGEKPVEFVNEKLRAFQARHNVTIAEIIVRLRRFIEQKSDGKGALSLFSGWGWNKLGYLFVFGTTLLSLHRVRLDQSFEQNAPFLLTGAITFVICFGILKISQRIGRAAMSRADKTQLRFLQMLGAGWLVALVVNHGAMIPLMSFMTFSFGPIFLVIHAISRWGKHDKNGQADR